MVTLRRIGIVSAGRVGFFFSVATSIMNFAIFMFYVFVIQGVPISILTPEILGVIAFNIVISSLIVSLGIGFFAFLYNLSSSIGGLQLEFEMQGGALTEKRKNDTFIDDEIEEIE